MVKVASYNIRKGIGTDRRRRPARVLDVLNEIGADIIALQEADRRFGLRQSALPPELIAAETDYIPVPFETRAESLGHHGNAILVRRGFSVLAHDILHLPTIEPRGAVLADIDVGGAAVRIVDRRDPPLPSILMGDMNQWSHHGGCMDEFVGGHHLAHTGPSFHSQRPMARLDRIFVSADLHILAAGTHHSLKARQASDHLPVWAELSFG
jgi:endonuclease/exonuclease/phosphatase family metal-dependent hydrolase